MAHRRAAIELRFLSDLHASNGKLISGPCSGEEVHAGSLLLKRQIVLDSALLEDSR